MHDLHGGMIQLTLVHLEFLLPDPTGYLVDPISYFYILYGSQRQHIYQKKRHAETDQR